METLIVAISVLLFSTPLLLLLGYGGWLSYNDIRTHRLPNKHVATFTLLVLGSEIAISWFTDEWDPFLAAIKTATANSSVYAALYVISRRQIGMGDVKYSVPTGLVLGYYNAQAWLICIFVTFVLAGLIALAGMATGRLSRTSRLAFGPYMTIATLALVVIHSVNSP